MCIRDRGTPSKLPKSSAVVSTGKLVDGFLTPDTVSKNFRVELAQSSYSMKEDSWSFILHNDTNEEIGAGEMYTFLNVRINGEWYLLPKPSIYSVSYTHLDVYKRQRQTSGRSGRKLHRQRG